MVEYEVSELDELTLAYATTIHKSQGLEYPIVVMPVLMSHYVMLQRNLIYTGITCAMKICVLIGAPKALAMAIRNMEVLKRNTKLKERINPLLVEASTTPSIQSPRIVPYTESQSVEEHLSMAAEPVIPYNKPNK